MAKKCPPVPPRIKKAAAELSTGTKKERSEAGEKMAKHRWKNHA